MALWLIIGVLLWRIWDLRKERDFEEYRANTYKNALNDWKKYADELQRGGKQ